MPKIKTKQKNKSNEDEHEIEGKETLKHIKGMDKSDLLDIYKEHDCDFSKWIKDSKVKEIQLRLNKDEEINKEKIYQKHKKQEKLLNLKR
jgi:hypothetical protein